MTVPNATTIAKGVIELATNAEASAGIDTTRAVTPAGVAAAIDDIPAVSSLIVLASRTDTTGSGNNRRFLSYTIEKSVSATGVVTITLVRNDQLYAEEGGN